MKTKKLDRNLRELFRHKLENAEIIPDPSVSSVLMKKLAVREFLHFNPVRFNIYYLAGIIAAGVAAVLIIAPGTGHKENSRPQEIINQLPIKDNSDNIIVPAEQSVKEQKQPSIAQRNVPAGRNAVPVKEPALSKEIVPEEITRRRDDSTPGRVYETLKGKELFNLTPEDNFKLQEKNTWGEQLFEASVTEGCAPLKVAFKNKLADNDSCLWTFGDGGSSTKKDPEWIYDIEGEYKVVLKVFGHEGMISESSSLISVFPGPAASFEIFPDKVLIPEDEVRFLNYSAGGVKYLWSFGDGNGSEQFEPVHRYEKFGNYNVSLKVYSENGCTDSLEVYNAYSGSAYYIEFPNAFIPNTGGPSGGFYSSKSDESAQVFHPSFSGVSEYHLKIFSKLGVLIFETSDINIGWDGYFKGKLSNPGVYIWKVRGNFSNGEPFTKMGDITLLRN